MSSEGLYRGIVIQNNDPEQSGRVKVFIPGVNLTQVKNWNQAAEEDKYFKVMGENTNSSLTPEILENQKMRLFWAEVMLPVTGAGSSGTYHAPSDKFFIGNDSDYNFQRGNKDTGAFMADAARALERLNNPPPNPSFGKLPRLKTLLDFPQMGSKFCINTGCTKPAKTNSPITKPAATNANIFTQLPRIYEDVSLVMDPSFPDLLRNSDISIRKQEESPLFDAVIRNRSVAKVVIDVVEPAIYLDGSLIPRDSPIFNRECFEVPDNNFTAVYNPPINFIEVSGTVRGGTLNELPVSLTINNREVDDMEFQLETFTSTDVTYSNNGVKVVVPLNNIRGVDIFYINFNFMMTRINALKPILRGDRVPGGSAFTKKPIMPRAPRSAGEPMISRGGGGGTLLNNIISTLLPIFMRLDAHIGGANNECRSNVNQGRQPLNDPNNTKGSNFRGCPSQAHRGPMRAPDYANEWKGMISIPGVGAHVWVRFESGDTNYPIVVGSFASQANYKGVYKSKSAEEVEPELPKEEVPSSEETPDPSTGPPEIVNPAPNGANDQTNIDLPTSSGSVNDTNLLLGSPPDEAGSEPPDLSDGVGLAEEVVVPDKPIKFRNKDFKKPNLPFTGDGQGTLDLFPEGNRSYPLD